jgi:hypothetical protein
MAPFWWWPGTVPLLTLSTISRPSSREFLPKQARFFRKKGRLGRLASRAGRGGGRQAGAIPQHREATGFRAYLKKVVAYCEVLPCLTVLADEAKVECRPCRTAASIVFGQVI